MLIKFVDRNRVLKYEVDFDRNNGFKFHFLNLPTYVCAKSTLYSGLMVCVCVTDFTDESCFSAFHIPESLRITKP